MNEEGAVPVTMRALTQRINRKLRHDGQRLRTARGWFSDLGHVLDFKHHWIVKRHVEPEARGRDLGVVKNYDQLLVGSWSYPNT